MEQCRNVELSKDAGTYLKRLFDTFKSDNNRLDLTGMEKIFATTEKGIPWKVTMETQYDNGVTFDLWIGLWEKAFALNPKDTFKNLVYIGYCARMKDAV